MICAEYSNPELHKHNAAHIIISLDEEIEVIINGENIQCRGIAIPSGVMHTANTNNNKVLVFLFDNTTNIANLINNIMVFSNESVEKLQEAYYSFEKSDKSNYSYREVIKYIYQCVNPKAAENILMDKRIKLALEYIRLNLHEQITCRDVANYVFLSEGRFSHLFKKEMGMSFSSYLVYQRIMATYVKITKGKSITEAAIESGFSSSSHFAKTNKQLFGLTASSITKDFIFYKIAGI